MGKNRNKRKRNRNRKTKKKEEKINLNFDDRIKRAVVDIFNILDPFKNEKFHFDIVEIIIQVIENFSDKCLEFLFYRVLDTLRDRLFEVDAYYDDEYDIWEISLRKDIDFEYKEGEVLVVYESTNDNKNKKQDIPDENKIKLSKKESEKLSEISKKDNFVDYLTKIFRFDKNEVKENDDKGDDKATPA